MDARSKSIDQPVRSEGSPAVIDFIIAVQHLSTAAELVRLQLPLGACACPSGWPLYLGRGGTRSGAEKPID